jgi:hypothetical protein
MFCQSQDVCKRESGNGFTVQCRGGGCVGSNTQLEWRCIFFLGGTMFVTCAVYVSINYMSDGGGGGGGGGGQEN